MAAPSSNPFYGSGTSSSAGMPTSSSTQRLALDNMIRRELKVADPGDPQQIAQALLTRYRDNPRAAAIVQEARGLPFLQSVAVEAKAVQAPTSSDTELQQAVDDVNRDLQELSTDALLKDIAPELQAWSSAIRSAVAESTAAARFALDTRQRDKAFGIRRTLGDYARMARLVGTLTPSVTFNYRNLAKSLDEVAAVLLVMMGEALANVGFAGGRFLLQAPYSELQIRRDAVIYALRNLIGGTQEAYAPNEWPRGLDAYRNLFLVLEAQGQGDLRALLVENELARIMDELIQRAAHGRAEGLRALGATAQLDLQRFRRLVIVGSQQVSPSPPLSAFLEALSLFAEAFDTAGGFRLLRIARPPILFYGLYGITGQEKADRRLLQLIIERGHLAENLDCLMRCDCSERTVHKQIILDKVLYDVDRAIDLYAVGDDDFGIPESRAAAYGYIAEAAKHHHPHDSIPNPQDSILHSHDSILQVIASLLIPPRDSENDYWDTVVEELSDEQKVLIREELCIQRSMELQWENLVKTMAPSCIGFSSIFGEKGVVTKVIDRAISDVVDSQNKECPTVDVLLPKHYESSLEDIAANILNKNPPPQSPVRQPSPRLGGPPSTPTPPQGPPYTTVPDVRQTPSPKSSGVSKEEKQEKPK